MTKKQTVTKRIFDIVLSLVAVVSLGWLIVIAVIIATFDTGKFGLFTQRRIGRYGKDFSVFKIRTMRDSGSSSVITTSSDDRITRIGRIFRATKIDELPQIVNVLIGDMSLVGPRPDVEGYWDRLTGDARRVLELRPGLTGPATVVFMDEEQLLDEQDDPVEFNDNVLFPKKVRLNIEYYDSYTMLKDIQCIAVTVRAVGRRFAKLLSSGFVAGTSIFSKKL